MGPTFLVFDEHIINITQVAHVSSTEDGVHVDMIGGGFHDIQGQTLKGFATLLNGAVF